MSNVVFVSVPLPKERFLKVPKENCDTERETYLERENNQLRFAAAVEVAKTLISSGSLSGVSTSDHLVADVVMVSTAIVNGISDGIDETMK